jgi:hypothetical protein
MNGTTKKVIKTLLEQKEALVNSLINGVTLKGNNGTAEETAKQIGMIYGLDLFLMMEVEDEEPKRVESS